MTKEVPEQLWRHVEDVLSRHSGDIPFVIGIGGRSGAGKSTFATALHDRLNTADFNALIVGADDFFKAPEERRHLEEWGPDHLRLTEARRVLAAIKSGERSISTQQYRRIPTKNLYDWQLSLDGIQVVIFEGLYAVSSDQALGSFVEFVDLALFMKAREEDCKRWRFQQESEKPVRKSQLDMQKHWAEGILPDTESNVNPSETNAEILIRVDSERRLTIERLSSR